MTFNHIVVAATLLLFCSVTTVRAKGFLKGRASLDADTFQREIESAMSEALGCGGHIGPLELTGIEKALAPIWASLPKISGERVERRSLRYVVHRHFSQKYALLIRGFEPSRPFNQSDWGNADILSQRVPSFVESALHSEHARENGFDLRDAVKVVATIEELVFDSESTLLEKVYDEQHKPTGRSLSYTGLAQVLESYMVHWMLSGDEETAQALLNDEKLRKEVIPHWDGVLEFVKGHISAMQFQRYRNPLANSLPDRNALAPKYSFEDAHQVVGQVTKSFASFWESECRTMTASLIELDKRNTGRVPLSTFYGTAVDGEWRFGESESYLRELGALDETSTWRGKQVIVPNYMQGMNNCIVSAPHYSVCCMNYCENILSDIEAYFAAPTADAAEILSIVGNMTSQTTLDLEDRPQLQGALSAQLEQIAATHGGTVPLHGRLFAQWLHYTFPRECPFPHKTGDTASATPFEFGNAALATDHEMKSLSQLASEDSRPMSHEEEQAWMSQWSSEEELIADYGSALRAPWESGRLAVGTSVIFIICGLLGIVGSSVKTMSPQSRGSLLPSHGKAHFV